MADGKLEEQSRDISCTALEASACLAWERVGRWVSCFSALAAEEHSRSSRRTLLARSDALECQSNQATRKGYPGANSKRDLG